MTELRCFVDWNTSTQFVDDDRVIVPDSEAERLGDLLREGAPITVSDIEGDEGLEATGIVVRSTTYDRWEVRIDAGSLRNV